MADSGDSSPLSAAATDDAHHDNSGSENGAAAAQVVVPPPSLPVPPPPPKVRLMVSYGGRIQPRPHDNQLSYVNGDTKILSIERPLRFPDFAARLSALAGSRGEICVKYQLPGEDLDALVTVTNDEDLEHLVLEYDRLHLFRASPGSGGGSSRGGSTPRLRVFLFPVQYPPPPQPAGLLEPRQDQTAEWFAVEDFNSVKPPQPEQQQPKQESVPLQSPPPAVQMAAVPHSMMVAPQKGLDYLSGFDYGYGFVPPPAVKVKDPAGDPPTMRENVPVEIPPKNEERHPNPAGDNAMVSPADFPRQIQDNLEKVQLTDNASQQPPPSPAQAAPAAPAAPVAPVPVALPRNGSDDCLTRNYPPGTVAQTTPQPQEYYHQKFPEKPPVLPPSSAPPATGFLPVPGRFPSVAPGSAAEHGPFFFIPAPPHGYYATSANPGGTSFYAVAPHNGNSNGNGTTPAPAVSNAPAYPQLAYDSNGRAIYYTSVLPQYPSAVNGMSVAATVLGTEPAKPVAAKPTPTVS